MHSQTHAHTHSHSYTVCDLLSFTEPHAGFKIAFNMFDADGNQMVDKREFLVVSVKAQNKNSVVFFFFFFVFSNSPMLASRKVMLLI